MQSELQMINQTKQNQPVSNRVQIMQWNKVFCNYDPILDHLVYIYMTSMYNYVDAYIVNN